jgi:hypothetical protein
MPSRSILGLMIDRGSARVNLLTPKYEEKLVREGRLIGWVGHRGKNRAGRRADIRELLAFRPNVPQEKTKRMRSWWISSSAHRKQIRITAMPNVLMRLWRRIVRFLKTKLWPGA